MLLDAANDPDASDQPAPASAAARPGSDEALMLAYAGGEATAFNTLYERHRSGLYGFLHRQSPRTAWVDDLFQETWLAVVKVRDDYRPTAAFRTWLYGIACNKLIDRVRLHEPSLLADFASAEADEADPLDRVADEAQLAPDDAAASRQVAAQLDAALRSLPANQREAFLLREQVGMSLNEIAALTGVSMETAKSRLRYAVARLKSALAGGV